MDTNMDNSDKLKNALDALERLLRMFQAERYLYLALSVVSFLILLVFAFQMVTGPLPSSDLMIAVFGGSGLIAGASARLSWFFNRAFRVIEHIIVGVGHAK